MVHPQIVDNFQINSLACGNLRLLAACVPLFQRWLGDIYKLAPLGSCLAVLHLTTGSVNQLLPDKVMYLYKFIKKHKCKMQAKMGWALEWMTKYVRK